MALDSDNENAIEGGRENSSATAKKARISEDNDDQSIPDFGATSDEGEVETELTSKGPSMIVQFVNVDGEDKGPKIDIPLTSTVAQMEQIVNKILANEENLPYSFFIDENEVAESLFFSVRELNISTEAVLKIIFQPMAIFRVRPVTRCTSTLPGHTDSVLHVSYSPDGSKLASGGGDTTVRFWDILTCTPKFTCKAHKNHVLCIAWSPDGKRFASADKKGVILIWDPTKGQQLGSPLARHKQWITCLSWEPMHMNADCERLASSSKDSTIKIWNVRTGCCLASLSGHLDSVECIKWGGENFLYSASRDRTIKVWNMGEEGNRLGILVRTLTGHAHRINTLALNCDYVLRTGPYGYDCKRYNSAEEAKEAALQRYDEVKGSGPEVLVSGSDDFTLFLWNPATDKHPVTRMYGHQKLVNHIAFSPDGRRLASAGFDRKVKIWDGKTGKCIATLIGHIDSVYNVAWSADSRYLVSASSDSTIKLWSMKTMKKAEATLPGHEDEVYTLDWSPNGEQVASGSKDRKIKLWSA